MGFLDSAVGRCFRDEQAGRAVVFPGGPRHRGYLIKSPAEELKIRAFLKMYVFAQLAIQLLGMFLAYESSQVIVYEWGRPAAHLLRTSCIFLVTYSVFVWLPFSLLWRSYKQARLSFVSAQDEVEISGKRPAQQQLFAILSVISLAILLLLGIAWLIRFK
jgi:hypothetical protein